MVRFIKRRRLPAVFYDAAMQKSRILATARVKRCGTCTFEVPEADVIVEDGQERCPMCADILTAEWKAQEEAGVAAIKSNAIECLTAPPQISVRALNENRGSAVTAITSTSGSMLSQSAPLVMTRTVANTILLKGVRLSSTDVIAYPSGITDSIPPVVTSTLITLTPIASVGMTPGAYPLQFNDNVYRNLFAVR